MIDPERTFAVASEDGIVDLIRKARHRLVVISPALSDGVAAALADRLLELGRLSIVVIVDADPEVYRLGFGTEKALDQLREASERYMFELRVQPGVRIGVVISDETTMVFSPVPQLIEAGSTSVEKPNAVILSGPATNRLADAAGAGSAEAGEKQEIGTQPLTPAAVEAVKQDLKANPPQPFDVARALRVFTSKVQYVELEVANYRFSSKRVLLPEELLDITDDQIKERISSRIRAPTDGLGKLKIPIKTADGVDEVEVDDKWLQAERKRIEDDYTFIVPNFGRVILGTHRQAFDNEIEDFKKNLETYHTAVLAALEVVKSDFEDRLLNEYLPKWQAHPPKRYARYKTPPTKENLELDLRHTFQDVLQKAISLEAPRVRVVYKNVAPESVRDTTFLDPLRKIMQQRNVPIAVINSLFASGDAAPASRDFERIA
jgi:hypothetical protein